MFWALVIIGIWVWALLKGVFAVLKHFEPIETKKEKK